MDMGPLGDKSTCHCCDCRGPSSMCDPQCQNKANRGYDKVFYSDGKLVDAAPNLTHEEYCEEIDRRVESFSRISLTEFLDIFK